METPVKRCAQCGKYKTVDCFGGDKKRPDGLRPWCKECHNACNKKWREANKDYYKLRHQENPERRKAYDAKYVKNNPDYLKAYYQNNKETIIGNVNKRRTKATYATPVWADKAKMRMIYRIASNLNNLHGYIKYHVDHVVPLQGKTVSGLHVHNNLRILLADENRRKKNKWKL